ncbi:UNVERIFIED_CONTAM: hypothetical protein GTU68_057120 [Idotea baltica]|nr:hypothetical protein [Idotea baltica]
MDLFGPIKRALADQNYETPTPIQAETIPPAIAGQDILGCAQTGTGKTAAFALPILDYLGQDKPAALKNRPVALILAPTRELAIQIGDSFKTYGKHVRFQQALVYGGVGQGQQVSALRGGVHVLIATPGRLIDLMDQGHINLSQIEINKTQGARQRALKAFRDFNIQVLVATDVAARGIDIDGVTHVVNYDMPVEPESYVHRVGRTGRAGAEGIAISFCTNEEVEELRAIERLIGQSLKVENPNLFDLNRPAKKQPKKSGGRSNGGQDSGGNGRSRRRKTKQSGSTSGNSQQPASGNRSFRFRKAKKKSNGSTGRSTSSV